VKNLKIRHSDRD